MRIDDLEVWQYGGQATWYFVSLPEEKAEEINVLYSEYKRGFGSLKVSVTIGETSWKTSIFPDSKSNSFFLPIKAEVRKKESIQAGSIVSISLDFLR